MGFGKIVIVIAIVIKKITVITIVFTVEYR